MPFYNPLGCGRPTVAKKHTLTVRYLDEGGNPIQADTTVLLEEGASYSYTAPSIEGYTPVVNSISGTMGTSDTTVSFTYTAVTTKYTLTIHYWDISSGSQVAYAPDYVGYYASGEAYSITSPSYPDTYRCNKPVVEGTMPSRDSSVNVYYFAAAPSKATLTIVPQDFTLTAGEALPDLYFTVSGVGSEMPTGTLTVVSTENGVTYSQTFDYDDPLSITRGTTLYNRLISVGVHPYYLEYSGDENYEACTSTEASITVNAIPGPDDPGPAPTPDDPDPTPTPTP